MSPDWPSCPACFCEDIEVLHESAPGSGTTHATLKCEDCGHVFRDVLASPKQVQVNAVVSDGADSRNVTLPLDKDGRVRVDDELFGEGHRLLVTAIEVEEARRVESAPVEDVRTLWCKVFDTITLKIAVNKGHITHSDEMEVVPEEEFFVGDEISVHNQPVRIKAIKTERGIRHRGSAQAREIVRLFTERTDWREEREGQERRQGTGRGGQGAGR